MTMGEVVLAGGVLVGALEYLGVGGQLGVVALLLALVLYGHKMLSVGARVRNAVAYGMVFALLLAVLLAAGWGRLDVTAITTDVGMVANGVSEFLGGVDLATIREVLPL
jgi:hypothetical protein